MSKSWRIHAAVFALYCGLAILITWPLLAVLSTHLAGYAFGDAREMTRNIWWMQFALQTGQPIAFQNYLGYPDGFMGVPLWAQPLQQFPAWLFAFIMPLPAAYNLTLLLTLALNGWAVYLLVRHLTTRTTPAIIAGVIFLAAPTIQGHLAGGHLGPIMQWPLVGFVYALLRVIHIPADGRGGFQTLPYGLSFYKYPAIKFTLLAVLFFLLTAFTHTLQIIYALLPIMIVFALMLLLRREWGALLRVITVGLLGSILLVIYLLPVANAALGTAAYTAAGGTVDFSLDLLAVITPSFNHPLFGQLDYPARVLGVNIVEGSAYIGILPALLMLVALWKLPDSRWLLAVFVLAWLLSLGPLLKIFDTPITLNIDSHATHITLPWLLLGDLPGINLARTPARFSFVMALTVALLAGFGAAEIENWLSRIFIGAHERDTNSLKHAQSESLSPSLNSGRDLGWGQKDHHAIVWSYQNLAPQILKWILPALTCILILFDYQSFWPLPTRPAQIPDEIAALAERDDIRAVFNIPWDNLLAAKDAVYLQTAHQRSLIAGQVTRITPVSPAKLSLLQATLDPALLDSAGADVVIVHHTYDENLAAFAREQFGAPRYEDAEIAIYDVPPATTTPEFSSVVMAENNVPNQADSYVYLPESGWVQILGRIETEARTVMLLADDTPIQRWANFPHTIDLFVPLAAGYHTLTLTAQPPCPHNVDHTLECRSLHLQGLTISNFTPAPLDAPVHYQQGISLLAASPPQIAENSLQIAFYWVFESARTDQDIRFLHVVNAAGEVVAQDDRPIGTYQPGEHHLDSARVSIADLPPGEYRLYVGWYAFPDTQPFPADTAPDGRVLVSVFQKP